MRKICNKCEVEKELSEFHKRKKSRDGFSHTCKECVNSKNRERHKEHKYQQGRRDRYSRNRDDQDFILKSKERSRKHYNSIEGRAASLLKTTKRISSKFDYVDDPVDLNFIIDKLMIGKCEVTGIDFCYDNKFETSKNPLSPSIDRIDSRIGYSKDNVRIVLWQYNLMKGELTDEQLFNIFDDYFKKRYGVTDERD